MDILKNLKEEVGYVFMQNKSGCYESG